MSFWEDWANRSFAWREKNSYDLHEGAGLCGISDSTLSRIESAKYQTKPVELLLSTLDVMGAELRIVDKTQQITHQQDGIPPGLKLDTRFLQELLNVLDWEENRRTFAKLFGSVVASIKMLELVTQNDYGDLTPDEWQFPELLKTLKVCIERRGYINFMHAQDLAAWAMGFFRNDVHRRLIIVLEACIFDWYRQHHIAQDKAALIGMPLVTKLQQLEAQADINEQAKRMITELIASIAEYQEGKKSIEGHVASLLTHPHNFPKNLQFSHLSARVARHISDAECVAIAYTFDIEAPYAEEPYSISYNKYFAITVHAVRWVAKFQHELLPR